MPPQVYVPPLDWPPGALRPVINYGNFPRYVGKERRVPAYYPTALLPNATQNLIGKLPQVNHGATRARTRPTPTPAPWSPCGRSCTKSC